MGMADPFPPRDIFHMPKAPSKILAMPLRPSSDTYITCIVCVRDHCDFEFTARSAHARLVQGIHLECAQTIGAVTNEKL